MKATLLQKFLKLEAASGIVLFAAAILAMIWANSPLAFLHQHFIEASLFWINEGLMAIFFLLVGLELKRAYLEGLLSHLRQISLPAMGALGGMLIPAIIYWYCNANDPVTIKGWAIPVATDIAFALGVLSLFGRRVPIALKLFLLALAIFDDLGAILIIAIFYSVDLSEILLFFAASFVIVLYVFNRLNVRSLIPYLVTGVLLWLSLLHSGLNPTIAGVILALMIPSSSRRGAYSSLRYLEDTIHPWVAYLIMPLFALANAGFSLQGLSMDILTSNVVLGITLGLFIGKQLGVLGFTGSMIQFGFCKLPEKTSWLALYGVTLLCGIGFTMSLFLGTLAFENDSIYLTEVRLGVILGSILSGMVGAMVLLIAFTRRKRSSSVDD